MTGSQSSGDIFRRASELAAAGEPFVLATVVRVEPPSSATPGNRALVFADGRIEGWIGGGCATPTVRTEALAALRGGGPRLVRITSDIDARAPLGVIVAPMTCDSRGTIDIWIEPFLPAPTLVVGGDSPVAEAISSLGATLGFNVVKIGAIASSSTAAMSRADDAIAEAATDARAMAALLAARVGGDSHETWLVAASHGAYDDELIEAGLRAGYRYAGVIASSARSAAIEARLIARGCDAAALVAFHPEAGVRIAAKTPEEIALSVLAEIVGERRRSELECHLVAPGSPLATSAPGDFAIDPICGMTVAVATAEFVVRDPDGATYFCCGGCRRAFLDARANSSV